VEHVAWNPTHPELLCSTSRKDMKVAFWDARQSKPIQSFNVSRKPLSIHYSPNGRTILMLDDDDKLSFLHLDANPEVAQLTWTASETARSSSGSITALAAVFNHSGNAIFLGCSDGAVKVIDYPGLELMEKSGAHVSGCYAVGLDPRGKYLATGGADSIVNLFDLSQWLCVRTFSPTDSSVNDVSFSFDGEYLASASDSSYIDISATETGQAIHRIPCITPAPIVAWHPSKHVLAFCGEHSQDPKLGWISLFGL